jgi:GNAT superfamily N-acetyltransferase
MLEIRAFEHQQIPAALALCAQVNWNHLAADWERCLALNPEACLGGFEGGVLKATCTLTPFGAVGWVGTFLVDQALRGQGCGKAVFEAMLKTARRQGIERLGLDSSDAGRPIYLKYGFQMTTEGVELWTGPAGGGAGDDNLTAARPLAPADWEALLAFDRASVQVSRERQFRLLAAEAGVSARVVVEDGVLCAFGFSRPGRLTGTIGPVVANSCHSAIRVVTALMADRRARDGEQAVGLAILDRPELRAWLQEHGFQMRRRNLRMFLPEPVPVLSGPQAFVATGLGMG